MFHLNSFHWTWSDIASVIGTIASIINIAVAIYIYRSWKTQKQKELIANEADFIIKEMRSIRQEMFIARNENRLNHEFANYVGEKRDLMEYALITIRSIDKNLSYTPYISSLTELIRIWQRKPQPENYDREMLNFIISMNELNKHLVKIKLFM